MTFTPEESAQISEMIKDISCMKDALGHLLTLMRTAKLGETEAIYSARIKVAESAIRFANNIIKPTLDA